VNGLDLVVLWIPLSAMLAGGVLSVSTRGELLEDGALIRQFVLLLAIAALLLYGIGTRDFVRVRVDPGYREEKAFLEHPLPAAMRQWSSSDANELRAFIAQRVAQGETTAEAFRQARRLLERKGARMVLFGDADARLAWARAELEGLKEQQARDPEACYRALAAQPLDAGAPSGGYSDANTVALHEALAALYESAPRMKQNRGVSSRAVSLAEGRAAYAPIYQAIASRWGDPIAKRLSGVGQFPFPVQEPADAVCAARIYQIEAILEQPAPVAAYLAGNLLR
jgi:hypothetical protein